ncbi:protein S100-A11 [Octodon degus]|uniref:Protein S100-A11 n=1 Tax=Octodon degus TaxID=10160 RepID=A0A6P6EIJ7_OCTDE|nr:protein S100-A11 [Octodon degus]
MSSPTETERCIESLIAVFQKYAGKDGNSVTLSKTEFLTFMNKELGAFTKNQKDPGVLDRMMKKLDLNSDGQLDFQEFLNPEAFLKVPGPGLTPSPAKYSDITSFRPTQALSRAHHRPM